MRLINADKLRHELIMGHDLVGAKYTDMADTVEAIPIEWIYDYAEKNFIDITVAEGQNPYIFKTEDIALAIAYMVVNWRKENEDTCMQLRQR